MAKLFHQKQFQEILINHIKEEARPKLSMDDLLKPVEKAEPKVEEVKEEIPKKPEFKENVIIHEDKVPENNEISDDQFFDDFFDD